jgi:hypothetical protein
MAAICVMCNTCNRFYEALFESGEQGIDCSADATEQGVIGYFGSTLVDLEMWKWAVGKPLHVKHGMICDPCIKPLIESGALVFERNYLS